MEEHLRHCLRLVLSEVEEATFTAFRYYVIEERLVEEVGRELNTTPDQIDKIKWRVAQKLGEQMKEVLGEAEQNDERLSD